MRTDPDRNAAEYQRALDTIERLLSNPPTAAGDDYVAREANREHVAALRHVRNMLQVGCSCQQVVDSLAPLCLCNVGPDTDGPEQDCAIHGDGETFVALCRWRDAVVSATHVATDPGIRNGTFNGNALVPRQPLDRLCALLDAGPWGGPDTDAAVAAAPQSATIGRDELERLRGIEARAQRIVEMEPSVALPGSQATALAILDSPLVGSHLEHVRALTEQVNSAAHRRLTDDADRPRPSEF